MGVIVLGMHRSGTSAVTRLLNVAGVPLPRLASFSGSAPNPRGFWEIRGLTEFNELLLRRLDGEWSAPPTLPSGWQEAPILRGLRRRANRKFRSIMGCEEWMWKDPRLCLTLPFWEGFTGPPTTVLVVRNPLEISQSLKKRNGFSHRLSVSLWERYMRTALRNVEGSPIAVVRYEALLADPVGWVTEARWWLEERGVRCDYMGSREELAACVEPALRHARFGSEDFRFDPILSDSQRWLFDYLASLEGFFDSLAVPLLPAETPWATALLEERRTERRAHRVRRSRWDRRLRRSIRRRAVELALLTRQWTSPGRLRRSRS